MSAPPPNRGRWTGIYAHGTAWRVVVSRGYGRTPIQRHFTKDTSLSVMWNWREDQKAKLRLERRQRAAMGPFASDAERYLRAVTGLSSFRERKADIARWVAEFGTRHRDTITALEIRTVRERWSLEPRGYAVNDLGERVALPPYAASTINHRLRALSNLYTLLDGPSAPNPVHEVPEVQEPDPRPRALDYATIRKILAALGDRGRPTKGEPNTAGSLTKLRLRVLAYTGLTFEQLRGIRPEDVDLERRRMFVRRRKKGKGAKGAILPLMPEAVDAFRALGAANGWGRFSGQSVRKSFILAATKVGVTGVRVYDLRHSFASAVYAGTGNLHTVAALLQHASTRTTERYALAVADEVLREKLKLASEALDKIRGMSPAEDREQS